MCSAYKEQKRINYSLLIMVFVRSDEISEKTEERFVLATSLAERIKKTNSPCEQMEL